MTDLHEASMSFDLDGLQPFLVRIRSRIAGLEQLDVDAIASTAANMKLDEEREWTFEVVHGDVRVPLQVRVFMDDIDAPDLYVFTSADLAKRIQHEMSAFADERGQ